MYVRHSEDVQDLILMYILFTFYVPKIVFDIIAWVFKFLLTLNDRIVQFVLVKM